MKIARKSRALRALLLAGIAAGVVSCEDAPPGSGGQVPTGLVVLDAGGSQVASFNGASVSGRIQVRVGQQQTFRVVLTSSGGGSVGFGSRYTLDPTAVNTGVAGVSVSGSDQIVVTGRGAGGTTIFLRVLDGGAVVLGPLVPVEVS